jgi:signal transduction histidine kinase
VRERAEPDRSAAAVATPAEAVLQRAWLPPSADSLTALALQPSPATWHVLRDDPGAVLLLLRRTGENAHRPSLLARMLDPAVLDEAVRLLDSHCEHAVDWNAPSVRPIYQACTTLATLARDRAVQTADCDVDEAWVCGLLAPLGWLGVCAAEPAAAAACLADPEFPQKPSQTQRRLWGMDQFALARRLARRWRLPDWLAAVIGCLRLPADLARHFGPDPALLRCVQQAVQQARLSGADLGLAMVGDLRSESSQPTVERSALDQATPKAWDSPNRPLLRELVATAAENLRLREAVHRARLEADIDRLHDALEEQASGEDGRLKAGKLGALAEFAAGAGHEINNPLAVISGQAQYLLAHAGDWFCGDGAQPRKALDVIVAQTHRIHGILRDLMLFARPAAPRPAWFDLPSLLAETAASLEELARQRRVRVEVGRSPDHLAAFADAEQVRAAVACLVRNAIEAAPADGWACVRVVEPGSDGVIEVAVEDGGPGPDPLQRPALFDPFYSGRTAGRGRGLGLPIAWRLAQQQGGDVRLDDGPAGGPTRFILSLPRISQKDAAAERLAS